MIYCIDTNVLLQDGSAFKKIDAKEIVIPFIVLEELDRNKTKLGDVGRNARLAIRYLDELREQGDLQKGVKNAEGVSIKVAHSPAIHEVLDYSIPDNQILGTALEISSKRKKVALITNDLSLRVKADLFGVGSEKYSTNQVADSADEVYSGITEIEVDSEVIDDFYNEGSCDLGLNFPPNHFVLLKSNSKEKHTAIGKFFDGKIVKSGGSGNVSGIKPKNLEQIVALDLLCDVDIPLVTLMGGAGSGKTFLSLAAGLDLMLNKGEYDKIIVVKNPVAVGQDIGFLPGLLSEKMEAWSGSVLDNFETLEHHFKCSLETLSSSGQLEILPPTFLRGRNLSSCYVLVDEAQSLNLHEMKTIVTRIADSSKLVMTGDIKQIDNMMVSCVDNGLSVVTESFKPYDLSGHVTLKKCERGGLAALANEIL